MSSSSSSQAQEDTGASASSSLSCKLQNNMEVIVSFPDLLSQEETITSTPHDVTAWCIYLGEIDTLLESIDEQQQQQVRRKKKKFLLGGKSIMGSSSSHDDEEYYDLSKVRHQLVQVRCFVAERAVTLLPGSYKLWRNHLSFCTSKHYYNHGTSFKNKKKFNHYVTSAYEQCLIRLHKCPRLWLEYLTFVQTQQHACCDDMTTTNVTTIRQLYDRALLALPVTQHDKIWPSYLEFTSQEKSSHNDDDDEAASSSNQQPQNLLEIPMETTLRVMRRYVTYDPSAKERLAQVCCKGQRWGEAALTYMEILNDHQQQPLFTSRHDLWLQLAEICTLHPQQVHRAGIDFDAIVRAVLPKHHSSSNQQQQQEASWTTYDKLVEQQDGDVNKQDGSDSTKQQQQALQQQLGEMEGTLWTKLADYHIRSGEFELARSIYEEALESVSKVRDFSIIFDAYVKFEEQVVEAMMAMQGDEEDEEEEGADTSQAKVDDEDWDILMGESMMAEEGGGEEGVSSSNTTADIELALARAEHLTSRRPLLLNRVLLRQNPHNVGEWLRRSELYVSRKIPEMAASSLEESLEKVHARRAVNGMPHQLVTALSKVYEEELHNVDKARNAYERICNQQCYQFRDVDDLAQCYAAWVELELRQEKWDDALGIARRAVSLNRDASNKAARGLHKSLVLWDLLLDLEESLGAVQTTKDSYNRALELRVATPMHVMNYANFLKDHKYFEESFTAYERGVELFAFPHPGAKLLWKNYLTSFIERYKGTKIERSRDLFGRCLESCAPPEVCSEFYMLNGQFEEEHGLTKRALGVYRAMCSKVPPEEKYTAYQLYIAKTIKYLGIPATRDIYQEAIAALADTPAAQMCLDFAKMETSLQELERARTVLAYGAQLADPRRNPEYWKTWHEFEVSHGNEETFREMLRVKRSVQAAFSTVNYNAAEMGAGTEALQDTLTNEQALSMIADREGVSVKDKPRIGGFVQGKRTAELAELGEVENRVAKLRKATADVTQTDGGGDDAAMADAGGDDEIYIDEDDEGGQESGPAGPAPSSSVHDVSTKAVPAAVFGGLAPSGKTDSSSEGGTSTPKVGALERLRAAAASNKGTSGSGDAQQ